MTHTYARCDDGTLREHPRTRYVRTYRTAHLSVCHAVRHRIAAAGTAAKCARHALHEHGAQNTSVGSTKITDCGPNVRKFGRSYVRTYE